MKIAICSDLHLEFGDIHLANDEGADVLILGGDILTAQELYDFQADDSELVASYTRKGKADLYRKFLAQVSADFEHVIYIAGNHEFYHGRYPDHYSTLAQECTKFRNLYFLEQQLVFIQDHCFLGATLWTDFNRGDPTTKAVIKNMLNDYRVIKRSDYTRLDPNDTQLRHVNTLAFIDRIISDNPDRRYVVVGHHAPSKFSTKLQYEKDFHMNGGYSSDLSDFMEKHPQIELWTHGHTHDEFDYKIHNTRVVCNPRGYAGYEEQSDKFKLKYLDL